MVGESNRDVKIAGYHAARGGTLTRDQNPNLVGTPHHALWDASWVRGNVKALAVAAVNADYESFDVEDE